MMAIDNYEFSIRRFTSLLLSSGVCLFSSFTMDPERDANGQIVPGPALAGEAADKGAASGKARLVIGIGESLTALPLPHHLAYGSVPRRFDRVERQRAI
jgi:hypothetical protein